jgi:hypothetical protein
LKSISTLVQDIRDRLTSGEPFEAKTVETFSHNLAAKLANRLAERQKANNLRLSNLGSKCDRKLWYSVHKPELSEPLGASTRLKFLFGDILEEVLLFLARAAGHDVQAEQAEVNLHGVIGHIDGIVDGELVDCKSASSYGFRKFKDHGLEQDDPFGYLTQIDGYLTASTSNPALANKSRSHFLAVDKQLGHITLDTYPKALVDYEELVNQKRAMLAKDTPPSRGYSDEPDGSSGNRRLGLACSYCPFKSSCWTGLRVFNYSRKPVFLTTVLREPKVPEMSLADARSED